MLVLVISPNPATLGTIADEIHKAGGACITAPSLGDVSRDVAFSGIVIDVVSAVRASKKEKDLFAELTRSVPVAKVRAKNGVVNAIFCGKIRSQYATIEDFVRGECADKTRSLRQYERIPAIVPVIISGAGHREKTVTINISEGGAFIFTVQPFAPGDTVSIASPQGDISGVVRWVQHWGTAGAMPGIGVMFSEPVGQLLLRPRQHADQEGSHVE